MSNPNLQPLAQDFVVAAQVPKHEWYFFHDPGLTRLDDGSLLIAAPQWKRPYAGAQRRLRLLRSDDGGRMGRAAHSPLPGRHTLCPQRQPVHVRATGNPPGRRMRTSNGLERLFGENRRRVKVIPHFFTEKAGIKLVYATLVAASQNWRGVTVTPEIAQVIDELWEAVYPHSRIETWAA